MKKKTIILGIETSCDETATAVVCDAEVPSKRILSNVVLAQHHEHRPYGGVVPEIAARSHLQHIDRLMDQAIDEAGVTITVSICPLISCSIPLSIFMSSRSICPEMTKIGDEAEYAVPIPALAFCKPGPGTINAVPIPPPALEYPSAMYVVACSCLVFINLIPGSLASPSSRW